MPHAAAIAVSPIVALASDKAVLATADSYLRAYEDFMGAMRDRYEAIASQSPKGARHLCAQLLVLDVVLFQAPSGARAILSPLHPLQLWKYVRLAQQLSRERESLSDEQKELLGASAAKLPHFVTALFVPEGLVAGQPLVLPQTYELATLPGYQEDTLANRAGEPVSIDSIGMTLGTSLRQTPGVLGSIGRSVKARKLNTAWNWDRETRTLKLPKEAGEMVLRALKAVGFERKEGGWKTIPGG